MGKFYCVKGEKWCRFLRKGICQIANARIDDVTKCPRIAEIETKTLYELIREVDFDRVFDRIVFYYESEKENKDGYREAFNTLLKKKQRVHHLNDLFIEIEIVNDCGTNYLDTFGISLKNPNIRYGIEVCTWSQWLTMFITKKTLSSLGKEDIVAGCLYEMTFFGFSEESIMDEKEKMYNSFEEIKNKMKNEEK